jgi:hypothetical protein
MKDAIRFMTGFIFGALPATALLFMLFIYGVPRP